MLQPHSRTRGQYVRSVQLVSHSDFLRVLLSGPVVLHDGAEAHKTLTEKHKCCHLTQPAGTSAEKHCGDPGRMTMTPGFCQRILTCFMGQTVFKEGFVYLFQIVLSVCLLPYHIFKPIFIYLASKQALLIPGHGIDCHPLSGMVEVTTIIFL